MNADNAARKTKKPSNGNNNNNNHHHLRNEFKVANTTNINDIHKFHKETEKQNLLLSLALTFASSRENDEFARKVSEKNNPSSLTAKGIHKQTGQTVFNTSSMTLN